MSQQPDPTKPWAHRLGQYRYSARNNTVIFADGREVPWAVVRERLTDDDGNAGSGATPPSRAAQPTTAQQSSSRTTETGPSLLALTDRTVAGPSTAPRAKTVQAKPAQPSSSRTAEAGTTSLTLTDRTVAGSGAPPQAKTAQSKTTQPKTAQQSASRTTKTGTTLSTFTDRAAAQEAQIEFGEAERLTPLDLQNASIAASRRIVETRGSANSKYKVQRSPLTAFKFGNVIELLYPDYAGADTAITPTRDYPGEFRMRRFVIIEQRAGCSAALPISTYGGQGVASRGIIRQDHVIIYTGPTPPAPTAEEGPVRLENGEVDRLRPTPIQVIPVHLGSALDPMSRLNLREHFVIDHHVEVFIFGSVAQQSASHLLYQFRDANPGPRSGSATGRPSAGPPTIAGSHPPVAGSPADDDDDDDDEDDEEDDDDDNREDQEVVTLALRIRALNDQARAQQALENLRRHDEATNRDMHPRVLAYLRRTAPRRNG